LQQHVTGKHEGEPEEEGASMLEDSLSASALWGVFLKAVPQGCGIAQASTLIAVLCYAPFKA
jgi:hypothetical protein